MNTLDELVRVHNSNRKKGKTMVKMAYIVFDVIGDVYGVYEELVDAEERIEDLVAKNDFVDHSNYLVEEYVFNKDYDHID